MYSGIFFIVMGVFYAVRCPNRVRGVVVGLVLFFLGVGVMLLRILKPSF